MKYCTQCGFQLDDDAAFCTQCGTPVSNTVDGETTEDVCEAVSVDIAKQTEGAGNSESTQQHKAEAAPATEEKKDSKLSPPLIIGIAAIVTAFIPNLNYVSPILSIVGIVLGVKEVKESGSKAGLILSIIGAVCFALPVIITLVGAVVSLIGTLVTYLIYGSAALATLPPILESLFEMLERIIG